jgi:hypothetical protein
MALKEPLGKTKMIRMLLKGRAVSRFEYHFRKRLLVLSMQHCPIPLGCKNTA